MSGVAAMSELYAELNIFGDQLHIGSAEHGFVFSLTVPVGRFPVLIQRHDERIGRATIIFDAELVDEAFGEEMYEPLDDIWLEGGLLLAGSAARAIWERDRRACVGSVEVDPTGANVVGVALEQGITAEVGWWYGGDESRPDEGIVAFDVIWDRALDPIDPDAPVRNMNAVVQAFFDEHGPPSLRTEEE